MTFWLVLAAFIVVYNILTRDQPRYVQHHVSRRSINTTTTANTIDGVLPGENVLPLSSTSASDAPVELVTPKARARKAAAPGTKGTRAPKDLSVGEMVSWVVTQGGNSQTICGTIHHVVPAGYHVDNLIGGIGGLRRRKVESEFHIQALRAKKVRPAKSYLVAVPASETGQKARLYWPQASHLQLTTRTASGNATRETSELEVEPAVHVAFEAAGEVESPHDAPPVVEDLILNNRALQPWEQ